MKSSRFISLPAILLLAACSGGNGPSPFDTGAAPTPTPITPPPPTPTAPTVSVTAPATATRSFAFTVSWSSTDATSCATEISSGTGATGTASLTETAIGSKTYTVTCTGAGGSASGSATTVVGAMPSAEGLWQGTTPAPERAIGGVVTAPNTFDDAAHSAAGSKYWLVYSKMGDPAAPAGFITGAGVSTAADGSSGNFASSDLRDFNFDAHNTGGSGSFSAPFTQKATLATPSSVVSGPIIATFDIAVTGDIPTVATTIAGSGIGVLDSSGTLTMDVTEHTAGALVVDLVSHDVLHGTWDGTTFTATSGTTNFSSCVGSPLCGAIPLGVDNNDSSVSGSFAAAGGSASISATLAGQTGNITYTATPPSQVITHFALNYLPAYETAPALASIAGSYTGSAGIGVNMGTPDAIFTVASDGAVTGTDTTSLCNYSATLTPHATGNVYDVTALTFTDAGAPGSCAYSSGAGTFTGVATYDGVSTLTVTAVNGDSSQGFLFVGTKP